MRKQYYGCRYFWITLLLTKWLVVSVVSSLPAQIPQLRSASIWRPERATKVICEKGYSFAEFQILSDEYPYWEPMDSLDLSRINTQLPEYKRWKADFEALNQKAPWYMDKCRHSDTILGWWFEYLTDTIVAHSPVPGSRAHALDMECFCLQMRADFLVRGETQSGKAIDVYLGSRSDSLVYAFYNGSYYTKLFPRQPKMAVARKDTGDVAAPDVQLDFFGEADSSNLDDDMGFDDFHESKRDGVVPFCFYSWRSNLVPPPLPNWVPRVIKRYEEDLKGQIDPNIVPPRKPRKPRRRS